MGAVVESTLDHVLSLQIVVAWAGEARCEPPRLGWWQTDLVDEAGGGDFLRRLLPRTAPWAALEAVREAARRTDARTRKASAEPDRILSIFHLGFEVDEQLEERLRHLKRTEGVPEAVLPEMALLRQSFDRELLTRHLTSRAQVDHRVTPAGRQLKGAVPAALDQLVERLAAALVPFADAYPLPHYRRDA